MDYPIIISLFTIIFISYLINNGIAMRAEQIIGGHPAMPGTFQHHIQILGKENFTNHKTIGCGGAAIAAYFVISAAYCYIDNMGQLRQKSYSILTGVVNLVDRHSIKIDVAIIYLPGYKRDFDWYDFAVLKLKLPLDTDIVVPLNLPEPDEPTFVTEATISGFGRDSGATCKMDEAIDLRNRKVHLKYVHVNILSDAECRNIKRSIKPSQFCGRLVQEDPRKLWFLEKGDSGTPLIINDMVVGIMSKGPSNIEDRTKCLIFSKVSFFVQFVNNVLKGIITDAMIVLHNRPRFL